ncbi:MAG: Rrf2 family transcriptional regulator [Verrucomicrobiae bacterium]|nr:Rrf2 family transcriptional regulator [Verrucomicrobiae bacterium]
MQVTRASEYGMLGLLALARRPLGEVVMVDVLAREEGVPASFLGKIFQSLCRAGFVASARGTGGGFSLSRPPTKITVLDVMEAVEGPIAFQRCLEPEAECGHKGGCALCGLFSEAQDRVKEVFGRTTLAELAGRHTAFVEHQARTGTTGPKHPVPAAAVANSGASEAPVAFRARRVPAPGRPRRPRAILLSKSKSYQP